MLSLDTAIGLLAFSLLLMQLQRQPGSGLAVHVTEVLMAFRAVTLPPYEFGAWLAAQRAPATAPATPLAHAGERVFMAEGCGACHAVRGTAATGRYGPDLTQVGGRLSLGADVLDNDPAGFGRWIRHKDTVKPDVDMPTYDHLDDASLNALAHDLEGLV